MKRDNWIAFIPFYLLTMILFIGIARGGSRAVTALAQTRAVSRENCIIIDPGHGGEDGGATSCTGVLESQINLEISLRLNDLMNLLGYDTIMIRTTDTAIYTKGETLAAKKASDLQERVRIVNETENGLLISIHQNTFSDSRYGGAQVFYAGTAGSAQLAARLQALLSETVNPGSVRQSKSADSIYLMQNIQRTGILVECGFLSNPEEEARLRDAEYQKKLCCVIAAAASQFLSNA